MIACVSALNKLYLAPIEYYEPDVVHLFISNRDDPVSSLEKEIYKNSKKDIICGRIVEHIIDTSDYEEVLGSIIDIKKALHQEFGPDLDIFINISSGTPEFSAAGMFASMLPQPAIAFRTEFRSSLSSEELLKIAEQVSGSLEVSEPDRVTGLKNDEPEDEMIAFLTVVSNILEGTKYPKYRAIIDGLKEIDAWSYDPDRKSGYGRTSLAERGERYLKRHYIAVALENGWIERPSPNTMRITDAGRAYVSVYRPAVYRDAQICWNSYDRASVNRSSRRECTVSKRSRISGHALHRRTSIDTADECSIIEPVTGTESSTVTFRTKGKKHTFTINMD